MSSHAEDVRSRYEAAWSRIENAVDRNIDAGEQELSRLLHTSYAQTVGEVPGGERVSIFWDTPTPAPYLAANRIIRDWIADTVIHHAAALDADAVIELGSGWGYNLFNIWMRGGPLDAHYVGLEYTDAGRRVASRIAKSATSGPKLDVHPFDYYELEWRWLAKKFERAVIYTSHSIEQITELPTNFVERVSTLADDFVCLHFEPVGWQIPGAQDRDAGFGQLEYSQKHGYNTNLWALLNQKAETGSIEIFDARANVMAVKLYNGTSTIFWRPTS